MGTRMADRVIRVMAWDGAQPVAGAMHLLGADTLYGRYWCSVADIPYLHFELCYYRAIDIAIARGLARVEAGAQGGHKLARGYGPVATWSAHRSEEHTSELQSLMRISYAVFCLKKKNQTIIYTPSIRETTQLIHTN